MKLTFKRDADTGKINVYKNGVYVGNMSLAEAEEAYCELADLVEAL